MKSFESLREYCLSLPGAEETFPFDEDTLVFKVGGKMFGLISISEPGTINLKCDPEKAMDWRERFEEVQSGYHMNKKHWNTVTLAGRLSNLEIKEMVDDSYNLVFRGLPKAIQQSISNLYK